MAAAAALCSAAAATPTYLSSCRVPAELPPRPSLRPVRIRSPSSLLPQPLSRYGRVPARANPALYGDHDTGPHQTPPVETVPAEEISIEVEGGEEVEEEWQEERGMLGLVTPVRAIKWATIGAISLSVGRAVYSTLTNPAFWTYFSWFFVIWPLPAAAALGAYSLLAALPTDFNKRKSRSAKERDQFISLAGSLTWLILVPLGIRNGFIEGWPLSLFLVYMYFFMISAILRYQRYGELSPKSKDKQWSTSLSKFSQIAFVASVVGGHWLAALESPLLYFSWNWQLPSRVAVIIITFAVLLHYNATYFLGKYFDRLVKPTALVVFGPYRFVRHPIYASYMLLFSGYCIALRAYWSMAFLVLASLLYYEQRVKLEEELLDEAFPGQYKAYRDRVKYKYFWLLY